MSGRNNKLKANGCIYVDPKGNASFNKASIGTASFSSVNNSSSPGEEVRKVKQINAAQETAQEMADNSTIKDSKGAAGIADHIKQDIQHTKNFISDVGSMYGSESKAAQLKAAKDAGASAEDIKKIEDISDNTLEFDNFKKKGGDYLENIGRGSKGLGAAKIGGYMLGVSMLTDMLNPFDDD